MNLFLYSNLLVTIISLALILLLLIYGRQKIHRIWTLCNFVILAWGVGTLIISYTTNLLFIYIGWQLALMGGYFIAALYYHTVYIFTASKNKLFLILSYLFTSLAAIFTLFNKVVPQIRLMFGSIYFPRATTAYLIIYLGWVLIATVASKELFKFMKSTTPVKRLQSKYLLIAFIIGFIGGGSVLWPSWGIFVYPFGNIGVALYALIGTYAITRHHLMDIDVLIKKSLVFAGMFVFVFGVFVGISLLVSQLIGGGRVISLFISAVLIAIGLRPIEIWLVNATNKYLFQKKYDYKEIIQAFIDEVITVLDLDRIVRSTLEILSKTIYPETASIFLYNQPQDKYETYSTIGTEDKRIALDSSNKLIVYLKNSKDIAFSGQVDSHAPADQDIQKEMQQLKAVICLPLVLRDDLLGFITLGKKKSDQEYSRDDVDVLRALARTESIAIANSQLLAEAAQSERRATIGTMAASIHHEVGNPLNVINTKIQLFLLKCKKGLTQGKSKEQIVEECESILNETISQTNRISEITKKLANFAKPGKEIKPELVDIPEQIDETLAVVGHELELERITTEKQIQPDLPKISADKRQIQQILFNLIKNAGQAIAKTGKITIKAYTVAGKVQIEITDTGEGIPQERIQKIFEPFFTTKSSRGGTGLGLSIVRQLVWRNKGEISLESKVGEGTTFILKFPAA